MAVLPGAVYVWSFERVVGRWGIGLSDRLLRFTAVSAAFLAVFSAPLYYLRAAYLHHRVVSPQGIVSFENRIADARSLPWWLFAVPVLYALLPAMIGTAAGRAVRSRDKFWRGIGRAMAGRDPAPRAWDYLFSSSPSAAVRMKLKAGPWLGGFFGEESYAAGYPEQPQDIYLERTFAMNQQDGSFVIDADGGPTDVGTALLVRWDEVEFLEVYAEEEAS